MRVASALLALFARTTVALVFAGAAQVAWAEPARENLISFQASASQEVAQDLLLITLQANQDGSQASEVQSGLKQVLEAALIEARQHAQAGAMEVRTGSFSVQPRYNNAGRPNGWQGSAQLILEGTDMVRISQTAGKLKQLNVVNVSYGLSRALREQMESSLTHQAIERFKARAGQIAADFGHKGYTLGEISVSSTEPGFEARPMMMAMRAKAADVAEAPLPVEPGKGLLQVTVNGQVILAP